MRTLKERFEQMPAWLIVALGLAVTAAVSAIDTATGPELSFYVFYFLPVALVTWFAGRRAGMFMAACCAVAWSASFLLAGGHYSSTAIFWWNSSIRFTSFVIIAGLTAALRKEYSQAHAISRTDFLTGLLNKRAFADVAETERLRCIRRECGLSIAYLDLDNFKEVNDTRGHDEGDRLLQTVARTLRQALRRTDLLARVGGDEFVVLLPEADFAATELVLHKLRDAVAEQVQHGGWPVTLSIGAAVFPAAGDSLEAMIHCADELMYAVKKAGRNSTKLQVVDASVLSAGKA